MSTATDEPISLRLLLTLMGLVTAGLIAGVIYTKLYGDRRMSVGEQRAIDRTCDNNCASIAEQTASELNDPEKLEAFARRCVVECRERMYKAVRDNRSALRHGGPPAEQKPADNR
ncbi:MAG: hypothetical protein KC613_07980 [Myxococcales bacterium]|nr:hypothetical protein [Myxococcales bacterium]MCB9521771.1 hypothetical protein [Myxococcales bacterium]